MFSIVGIEESAIVAKQGAEAAKAAREPIEIGTGKAVVSPVNAKDLRQNAIEADEEK